MLKKISFILIFTIIVSFCSVSVFAAGDDPAGKNAAETTVSKAVDEPEPSLITVTRPGRYELFESKFYLVRFITNYNRVRVKLLRANQDGKYEELVNTDGESSWLCPTANLYSQEIKLNKGENNIRIVATYTKRIKVKEGKGDDPDIYKDDVREESYDASITFADNPKESAKNQKTDLTKKLDSLNPCKK